MRCADDESRELHCGVSMLTMKLVELRARGRRDLRRFRVSGFLQPPAMVYVDFGMAVHSWVGFEQSFAYTTPDSPVIDVVQKVNSGP
jgi:hypothetical protein